MTDIEIDPNTVESLIRQFLGGFSRPKESQNNAVAVVSASATKIDLVYRSATELNLLGSGDVTVVIANMLIGTGEDPETLISIPMPADDSILRCDYWVLGTYSVEAPVYQEGSFTLRNALGVATLVRATPLFDGSRIDLDTEGGASVQIALEQHVSQNWRGRALARYWLVG